MVRPFRFAVVSDPHVTLPHTLRETPNRFHLVEVSIPALEQILQSLADQNLDFLLMPGDLTQHGERENHEWLAERLQKLPFPTYVVPGNHDVIVRDGCDRTPSLSEFAQIYRPFGYTTAQPYYCQELLPDVYLVGLNSIAFDAAGQQLYSGFVDETQLIWLSEQLARLRAKFVMVMIHHNVLEHLPGQSRHPLGQRYIVQNRNSLMERLAAGGVNLIFTGHLHVQDVAHTDQLWEITTGSLVSYPHPYRLITMTPQSSGQLQVEVESFRVQGVPDWQDLQAISHQWMSDRAIPFMTKLLTSPPFNLPMAKAVAYAPELKNFWADISAGDSFFDYPHLPDAVNQHLKAFGAINRAGHYSPIDNCSTFLLPTFSKA